MNKPCFKCGKVLPISEFYAHKQMPDGHLNKCKTCNKKDSKDRVERVKQDPEWVEKERIRCLLKGRKILFKRRSKIVVTSSDKEEARKHFACSSSSKRYANTTLANAIKRGRLTRGSCAVCSSPNAQGHHSDYSKPLEVTWLCPKHHRKEHARLLDVKVACEIQGSSIYEQ